MMEREREIAIRKMGLSGGIHGISMLEIKELERKYGIPCSSYSCASCIANFLKWLERSYPLEKFLKENE